MTDGGIPIAPSAAPPSGAFVAPTPQNTPLNTAPITSGLSRPTVPDIPEGDDDDDEEDGGALDSASAIQNAMLGMVQGRLNSLIGRSSGYIETLPKVIRIRVEALKGVHTEYNKIQAEYRKELMELDRKYLTLYQPVFDRRFAIVNGEAEPTEKEITAGEGESLKDDPEATPVSEITESQEDAAKTKNVRGIPEFWLTALRNNLDINELITDRDAEAIRSLLDIRVELLKQGTIGFQLSFLFGPNEYFTNECLTKTYYYKEELNYEGGNIFDRAEGCKIDWKDDKDLTKEIEVRKQRNKNTNKTRIVKKTKSTPSFFDFFSPPVPPDEDAVENGDLEAEDMDEIEAKIDFDVTVGEDIKDRIIPRAIDWFTGKALEYELDSDEDEEGSRGSAFDAGDDDDDDDDDDEDDLPASRKRPAKAGSTGQTGGQECKNQ